MKNHIKGAIMYKFKNRLAALLSAAAMSATLMFPLVKVSAEEQYHVRDPFYNYANGYNYIPQTDNFLYRLYNAERGIFLHPRPLRRIRFFYRRRNRFCQTDNNINPSA